MSFHSDMLEAVRAVRSIADNLYDDLMLEFPEEDGFEWDDTKKEKEKVFEVLTSAISYMDYLKDKAVD